jgi:hypothetical protein
VAGNGPDETLALARIEAVMAVARAITSAAQLDRATELIRIAHARATALTDPGRGGARGRALDGRRGRKVARHARKMGVCRMNDIRGT